MNAPFVTDAVVSVEGLLSAELKKVCSPSPVTSKIAISGAKKVDLKFMLVFIKADDLLFISKLVLWDA